MKVVDEGHSGFQDSIILLQFNALVHQCGYGRLFRGWRGFLSNSLGISGSMCREIPPTSFPCPAAEHPPG